MLKIEYKSSSGTVEMGGSTSSGLPLNVTKLVGFGLPSPELKTAVFAEQPGVTLLSVRDNARTLTISGTFRGTADELQHIYSVLYAPGTLYLTFGDIKRKIDCRLNADVEAEKIGKTGFYNIVMQFQAQYPYFLDSEETVSPLFTRINHINEPDSEGVYSNEFTLPMIFTTRQTGELISLPGEKSVYPEIIISKGTPLLLTLQSEPEQAGVRIINETTGASITLWYEISDNEVVTIDLPHRRIYNSSGTVLTNFISDDTVLGNFLLMPGQNQISVENISQGASLNVYLKYHAEYAAVAR